MLWTWPSNRYGGVWGDMDRLQREMSRLFDPLTRGGGLLQDSFPPVNIWTGEDAALLTAEIPGIDPATVEVTVKDDTVTLRGTMQPDEISEKEAWIRRERGTGSFVRSFALPFNVEADKVEARYRLGILEIKLPKREADKPKKIAIRSA